jgi:hypothetical protein
MKVNYHLLASSIVLNHAGKTFSIPKGDVRFEKIIQAIRDNDDAKVIELMDAGNMYLKFGLTLKDGLIELDGDLLPESLSHRIIALVEANLPPQIMLNFWKNLKANPSFNSRKMLYQFLSHNGHPLTEDGCFIAYRGVTEDFKDVHTKTFDNKPGSVCSVERSEVDDNPNNTCSHGLHVACFDYAKGFGPKLVEVKVNPRDVVTVPVDYNGTKMRVCRFEVLAECEGLLSGPVYEEDEEEEQEENDYYSSDDLYSSYDSAFDDDEDEGDDDIPY